MIAQAALGAGIEEPARSSPRMTPLAATVRAMPAFQGSDGKFSKPVFDNALRNNGYTEARFLDQLRADIAQRQLLSTLGGSVAAPDAEVKPLYEAEFEKRSADMALFPLAAAPEPAAPDEAALQRWYDNHPDSYTTPEFRRIKAIELSPQSLASEITVTDDGPARRLRRAQGGVRDAGEAVGRGDFGAGRGEGARRLADEMARRGRTGPRCRRRRKADGAARRSPRTTRRQVQFPDPDLAKAVFAAPADTVSEPVKGQLGWFVVKVTKISGGTTTTFDQAKDALRTGCWPARRRT